MRHALVVAAAALALACGSRSGLLGFASTDAGSGGTKPSGGTGGSSATGGVAATGGIGGVGGTVAGGGTGGFGAVGGCGFLTEIQPRQTVEQIEPVNDRRPRLGFATDAQDQTTVLLARSPGAGNVTSLVHTTFAPWLNWPSSGTIGPTFQTFSSPELSDDFRIGASSNG